MTAALKKIVEEVARLSEEERRELKAVLEGSPDLTEQSSTETELDRKLVAEGFLTLPTSSSSFSEPLPSPVATRGRALSELLLEERR